MTFLKVWVEAGIRKQHIFVCVWVYFHVFASKNGLKICQKVACLDFRTALMWFSNDLLNNAKISDTISDSFLTQRLKVRRPDYCAAIWNWLESIWSKSLFIYIYSWYIYTHDFPIFNLIYLIHSFINFSEQICTNYKYVWTFVTVRVSKIFAIFFIWFFFLNIFLDNHIIIW